MWTFRGRLPTQGWRREAAGLVDHSEIVTAEKTAWSCSYIENGVSLIIEEACVHMPRTNSPASFNVHAVRELSICYPQPSGSFLNRLAFPALPQMSSSQGEAHLDGMEAPFTLGWPVQPTDIIAVSRHSGLMTDPQLQWSQAVSTGCGLPSDCSAPVAAWMSLEKSSLTDALR